MDSTGLLFILLCGELAATAIAIVLAFACCRSAVRRPGDGAKPPAADDAAGDGRSDGPAPVRFGGS